MLEKTQGSNVHCILRRVTMSAEKDDHECRESDDHECREG